MKPIAAARLRQQVTTPSGICLCFSEDFTNGLGAYSIFLSDGTHDMSSISIVDDTYGKALDIPAFSGYMFFKRSIVQALNPRKIKFKVKVTSINSDDGTSVYFTAGSPLSATVRVVFDPVRESYYDGSRRPWTWINGPQLFGMDTLVTVGVWYQVEYVFDGAGYYTYTLTDLSTTTVVKTLSGTQTVTRIDTLAFTADGASGGSGTRYSNLEVYSTCPCP